MSDDLKIKKYDKPFYKRLGFYWDIFLLFIILLMFIYSRNVEDECFNICENYGKICYGDDVKCYAVNKGVVIQQNTSVPRSEQRVWVPELINTTPNITKLREMSKESDKK